MNLLEWTQGSALIESRQRFAMLFDWPFAKFRKAGTVHRYSRETTQLEVSRGSGFRSTSFQVLRAIGSASLVFARRTAGSLALLEYLSHTRAQQPRYSPRVRDAHELSSNIGM